MAEVRYAESIEIGVSPERVWAYRLDFDNLPAYNPDVTGFKRIDGGAGPGVGATYSFTVTTEYGTVPGTLRVVEAVRPSRIVDDMSFGLTAREVCTCEPVGGGTRITLDVTVFVPDDLDQAGRELIERSGRKPVRTELENMKRILES